MDRPIIVQRIPLEDVIAHDKCRYNTNNHWTDGVPPSDYTNVCEQTYTSRWIDGVKTYKTINVDMNNPLARWMHQAFRMGVHTGKFPRAFEDELESYILSNQYPDIFDGSKYFVRTDIVSLKGGQHGAGPYTDFRSVLESLVTCHMSHTPIQDRTESIKLYLIPWVEIPQGSEYRVFVYQGKITAISQQDLYCVREDRISTHWEKHIEVITTYFESFLKQHLNHVWSYAIDIAVMEDEKPFFIEINPFGKEYSSGSSLFGWLQDEDILLGRAMHDVTDEIGSTDPIYFRYTVSSI